jgi:DNA-binding transcriptional ArsR family regulator
VLTVDAVFKALADQTRRQLLDSLRDTAGQTLTELESGLGMTRFGVMKHLKVLEEAKLVTSRKEGRFKYHYLNAAPIQEVADRWIAPYQKPFTRFALDLKHQLESSVPMADKPNFVLETYIRTTPRRCGMHSPGPSSRRSTITARGSTAS